MLDGDNLRHGLNGNLGLRRRGPDRERPPGRRGRPAVRRRRGDRHRAPDQPVRRLTGTASAPATTRPASASSRSSWTPRSRSASAGTPRASTSRPGPASSPTSPELTIPYEAPTRPDLVLGPGLAPDAAARQISAMLEEDQGGNEHGSGTGRAREPDLTVHRRRRSGVDDRDRDRPLVFATGRRRHRRRDGSAAASAASTTTRRSSPSTTTTTTAPRRRPTTTTTPRPALAAAPAARAARAEPATTGGSSQRE